MSLDMVNGKILKSKTQDGGPLPSMQAPIDRKEVVTGCAARLNHNKNNNKKEIALCKTPRTGTKARQRTASAWHMQIQRS